MALEKLRNNNLKERQEHYNSFDKKKRSRDGIKGYITIDQKKVYEILRQKMNGAVSTFIK